MSTGTAATVTVDLGGRTVSVPKAGLFDRYRMDVPLDEVAADPRVPGVDFFRTLPKTEVQSPIGSTRTPNFYYAMSSARLTLLAPSSAIRKRLPEELSPLEIAPGVGVVSLMLFRYDVCDIDFYTEAAVGVAVRPARNGGRRTAVADAVSALGDDHLHSYVLSLPVNTEIAQVRGHDGYGFPKWVTGLDVDIDETSTSARIANADGGIDVALSAATPKQRRFASGEKVSTLTSYTKREGAWHSTLNQTNILASGSSVLPRGLDLQLGEGRMADDLRSLKTIRAISFDVNTSAQAALHMPVPFSVR
ncbi:acetoacetate decarboxylase family protein [Tsukamurella strandjordii]|uniref:Acetoacetate decarboxylase family protein n=1 Tax=Tsukamurella strandjordii TaxID=147577 RepID=A0AA90NH81_9ACTN|nr:acetoacetate decarboxylase family protein [Tsukamurella strandjordii]MDP0399028.1 acetoacetate decarboxylase family protein [Tsukamurella strandjordii]